MYHTPLINLKVDERVLCDAEMILLGGFGEVKGFMEKEDYEKTQKE